MADAAQTTIWFKARCAHTLRRERVCRDGEYRDSLASLRVVLGWLPAIGQ
jgi:hypothetical protein